METMKQRKYKMETMKQRKEMSRKDKAIVIISAIWPLGITALILGLATKGFSRLIEGQDVYLVTFYALVFVNAMSGWLNWAISWISRSRR